MRFFFFFWHEFHDTNDVDFEVAKTSIFRVQKDVLFDVEKTTKIKAGNDSTFRVRGGTHPVT